MQGKRKGTEVVAGVQYESKCERRRFVVSQRAGAPDGVRVHADSTGASENKVQGMSCLPQQ